MLIRVSTPDASGAVTITGQAGSVPSNSLVVAATLDTGDFKLVRAGGDGAFSARLFAPAGTTIQIKADTTGRQAGGIGRSQPGTPHATGWLEYLG
jgi:hypothetical protein